MLRGIKVKEGALLGKIYHKFQKLGPGHEQEVRAWVRKMQTGLMAQVEKGEDLDGQILRLANLLTTLYNKAEAMARIFWERYPTPSYLKTIGTEIKHSMTIQSGSLAGVILEGTIDKVVHDTRGVDVWIRDHKSTGMKTLDVIFAGFPWSTQSRIYRILAKDRFPDNKIVGFILDGIMKPGIKLCGKDEKNSKVWNCDVNEAYLRRVKEWYAEKDTDAIKSRAIMFNEPLYSQELQHELLMMQNLSSRPNDPLMYSRDPSRFHCYLYDSACIYLDLCESPKSRWPELFDTKYKIKEEKENENTKISS